MKYACTILILLAVLNVQAQREQRAKIDSFVRRLEQLRLQFGIPSVSFAVVKDGQLIYSGGLGYADSTGSIKATDSTIYSIASLTKPISATLMAKLVEQKILRWEDKMGDHWPGYKSYYDSFARKWAKESPSYLPLIEDYNYNGNDITIRHHLSHTSEGVPGSQFRYNGFLFGGISMVVDNCCPPGFKAMLQNEIIDKLQLHYSSVDFESVKGTRQERLLSLPHLYQHGKLSPATSYPQPHTISGAAGFLSSARDLALFDIALDKGLLISPQYFQQMSTPYAFEDGRKSVYGLGWFITSLQAEKVIYHHGLQESFSAIYLKIPAQKLTLILLSNCPLLTLNYHNDMVKGNIASNPFINAFLECFCY